MDLKHQIEQKKKRSDIISSFVIDSTIIQDLATQVLNADDTSLQAASFQEVCDTLKDLCDEVASSLYSLKDMIPDAPVSRFPRVDSLNPLPSED